MYPIKQSSTAQPLVFLMVASSDHLTGATGLSPTVTLSKSGAAFVSPAGTVSEIGNGWYKVAGNATDSGTLGPLLLHATASGADPTDARYEVVAYDPQSAASLGLTNLDAAVSSRGTSTYAGGAVASVTGAVGSVTAGVTVATNNDKTGYALSATGLDSIPITAPTGAPTTFRQMVVMVYRRFFAKATETVSQLVTYADDGTTAIMTQAISDDGTTQTQGAGS